ncbi:hypothetical protein [Robinsoniella peoriensis]
MFACKRIESKRIENKRNESKKILEAEGFNAFGSKFKKQKDRG